jgi:hypothetical protein
LPQKFEFEIWNSKIKRENRTENVKEKEKEMGLLGWNQRVLAHFPTSIARPSSILFAGVTYAWGPSVSVSRSICRSSSLPGFTDAANVPRMARRCSAGITNLPPGSRGYDLVHAHLLGLSQGIKPSPQSPSPSPPELKRSRSRSIEFTHSPLSLAVQERGSRGG